MPKHSELAAKLLKDAAQFFETIAEQNPQLADQMRENSSVFRQVGDLVEKDPEGVIKDDTPTPIGDGKEPVFFERDKWTETAFGDLDRGDALEFSDRSGGIVWKKVEGDVVSTLIDLLDEILLEGDLILLRTSQLWMCEPEFYPGARLYHAVTEKSDGLFVEFTPNAMTDQKRKVIALSKDRSGLYELNRSVPVAIDGSEYDYLLFYMYSLRPDESKFRVIHGTLAKYITDSLSARGLHGSLHLIRQPQLLRLSGSGGCLYRVTVLFADKIFSTTLKLNYNGDVDMLEDEELSVDFHHLRALDS